MRADREELAKRMLRAALTTSPLDIAGWLHGAGWLIAMGRGSELGGAPEGIDLLQELRAVDTGPLADGALGIAAGVTCEEADEEPRDSGEYADELMDHLEARTRFELQRLGAEHLESRTTVLTDTQSADVEYFEETVRPLLFHLVAANEARAALHDDLATSHRRRFWWLREGLGIPATSVAHLSSVAMLVARFPNARRELETLAATYHLWTTNGGTGRNRAADDSKVVSLLDWARDRGSSRGGGADQPADGDGRLQVAAKDESSERIRLAEALGCVVSLYAPRELVVDVEQDLGSAVPALRLPDGRVVHAQSDPEDPGRYTFDLDEELFAAEPATLVVPLTDGTLELRLPPDREDG